jgi:phosphopentomutase
MRRRAIVIVLDGLGVGEMPDARLYGDEGSNTYGHVAQKMPHLKIPNLKALGLHNLITRNSSRHTPAIGAYAKSAILSKGKDSITGHWEISGIILKKPFPIYPKGFPRHIIKKFETLTGRKVIGNYPASGSEIIQVLGEEHCKTGALIVYTSADSVFQICGHEKYLSLEKLYEYCRQARAMLTGRHSVGRIIARPFLGSKRGYYRTRNRRDFSLPPVKTTMLDKFNRSGIRVLAVGKIGDIFTNRGIHKLYPTKSNIEGIKKTIELIKSGSSAQFMLQQRKEVAPLGILNKSEFIFTNLIDFDMLYGHRNDWKGYACALEEFDRYLPRILKSLNDDDMLILTSDHGCDPVTPSTDHSREYVPVLVYGRMIKPNTNFGVRKTQADIAATLTEFYELPRWPAGKSFLMEILL